MPLLFLQGTRDKLAEEALIRSVVRGLGKRATLRFVTYRLTSDYTWQLWTSSEPFAALTPGEWVRQGFRTEPVPAGTIAFSFGLRLESVGAVNVDDFEGAPVVP